MMELLVVKAGNEYFRFKNGEGTLCPMEKASVFDMHRLPEIRQLHGNLLKRGIAASIVKLTINEEPFGEGVER